jgi:hypothetical protein
MPGLVETCFYLTPFAVVALEDPDIKYLVEYHGPGRPAGPGVRLDERTVSNVSPRPSGLVKSPRELRDLLPYLPSDNPLPP